MSVDAGERELVDTLAEIWIAVRQRRVAKAATKLGPPARTSGEYVSAGRPISTP